MKKRLRTISAMTKAFLTRPHVLAIILWFLCGVWGCNKEIPAPAELYGRWATDNPRYKGCAMEISEKRVVFQNIEGQTEVYDVSRIDIKVEKGLKIYRLTYTDQDNNEFLLTLNFVAQGPKKQLQFYNQKYLLWNNVGLTKPDHGKPHGAPSSKPE